MTKAKNQKKIFLIVRKCTVRSKLSAKGSLLSVNKLLIVFGFINLLWNITIIAGPPRLLRPPRPLPKFWVSICYYKKQQVKKIWGKILGLLCLKFAVAALNCKYCSTMFNKIFFTKFTGKCHYMFLNEFAFKFKYNCRYCSANFSDKKLHLSIVTKNSVSQVTCHVK